MVVSLQTLVFAVATLSLQEVYSAYKLILWSGNLLNHLGCSVGGMYINDKRV